MLSKQIQIPLVNIAGDCRKIPARLQASCLLLWANPTYEKQTYRTVRVGLIIHITHGLTHEFLQTATIPSSSEFYLQTFTLHNFQKHDCYRKYNILQELELPMRLNYCFSLPQGFANKLSNDKLHFKIKSLRLSSFDSLSKRILYKRFISSACCVTSSPVRAYRRSEEEHEMQQSLQELVALPEQNTFPAAVQTLTSQRYLEKLLLT